jgi:peptidoglycan/xylan/chitin deacetylase (PgdA/CDA1 family)
MRLSLHHLSRALVTLALAASACAPPTGPLTAPAPPAAPVAAAAPEVAREVAPTTVAAPELTAKGAPVAAPTPALPDEVAPAPPTPTAPHTRTRAVVLMYHLFGGIHSPMAVETAAFDEQMRWLVEHRVPIVTTAALMSFLEGGIDLPERAAVVTLDDGHVSVYARAYPILKKYGVPFTLALNTEAIERGRPEAVRWDDVRDMVSSGLCEIASHSHIHGHMERLTDAMNRREVEESRSILEARTGVRPEAFVYPFGGNDARVRQIVEEAGYRAAFAVGGVVTSAGSPRFRIPRVGVGRSTTLAAFARLFGEPARPATSPTANVGAQGMAHGSHS